MISSSDLTIIHQDDSLVVVEKPGGVLSVPGRGPDKQDCIVNRLKNVIPSCMEQPAVHRLDMDTSGLMVLALCSDAHRNLSRQFQEREVEKRYEALLDGEVEEERGEIQLSFRLDVDNRPHQIYDPVHGKLGITLWEKLGVENRLTRIAFTPVTGRTHQLRVHAAHELGLGYPIIGDRLYGGGKLGDSLMLHARYLRFRHPESGETLRFESKVPF
ncbi:MAG: RluA family pseudouridine synthase [Desulfobulbaceae bacterium]|nr:RluA family pseudouridine synthase [Desulfobulbaceae bacterium]